VILIDHNLFLLKKQRQTAGKNGCSKAASSRHCLPWIPFLSACSGVSAGHGHCGRVLLLFSAKELLYVPYLFQTPSEFSAKLIEF
jgi:hypothetical protein